jgi:hypothetical protein
MALRRSTSNAGGLRILGAKTGFKRELFTGRSPPLQNRNNAPPIVTIGKT